MTCDCRTTTRLATLCLLVLLQFAASGALPQTSQGTFPVRASENRKYLVDARNRPFLVEGDAAWSLIAELKKPDVEAYLSDRKKRGFNTLLVNLLEHQFSSNPPANAYGDRPFDGDSDGNGGFRQMNESYFDHARWVVSRARDMGFLVLLAPAYLGAGGGGQGWYLEARAAGPQALHDYGEYLGRRFAGLDNIVWTHGGDYDPPEKDLVRAVVGGIRSVAPDSLHAVHPARDTTTTDYWRADDWLMLDTVYTYENVYQAVLARTRTDQTMPALFIEGLYEGEHGTGAKAIRREAYGAMLAGATGLIYGNNPIWHFGTGGIESADTTWQEALASPGAISMTHFRTLFESVAWWKLAGKPGRPWIAPADGLISATASDGSFAIAYLYDADAATLLPTAARLADLAWFDPATGHWQPATAPETGSATTVRPPTRLNGADDDDWVLLVRYTD